ncbi:MAG TPA: hypothetical protein VF442_01020 [Sphingobium sp.]
MMAVVMRPYHAEDPSDLKAEYARVDAATAKLFREEIDRLRNLAELRPGSAMADFNAMRYDALKRTAMQLASDLERALRNSGFEK